MLNWINIVLSVAGIGCFVLTKWHLARVNRLDAVVHNSNPVYAAHNFQYEKIRLPWVFHLLLALACYKLFEQIVVLSSI